MCDFKLHQKINKGFTPRSPLGVPPRWRGTPGGSPKLKYSQSDSRSFNDVQKYNYGATLSWIQR